VDLMMEAPQNMFWGLVVKPGKRYESKVANAFRLTKACLEPSTAGGKVSSVMVECDTGENFIVTNLNLKTFSENLNVSFNEGEKICFKVDGPGTVHLTGNLAPEQESMPMMMDDSSDDEDISQLEDIALEAQRIRDGIKTLPSGGVGGESSDSEDDEEEEEEDEEDEEDDEENEEESSDGEDEDGSEEEVAAPDANNSGKRKLGSDGDNAKRMKVNGAENKDEDSEDDDEDEDEDSDEDDSEEDGGDDLPDFDNINTKDLTAAQVKKLEMVKKMFEAAKGKVAKEADIFEKNKAAGSATKKAGDVNDNVKPKEKPANHKPEAPAAKDSSIAAVTKEALAQKEKSEKAAALAKIKSNSAQQKEWTLKGGVTVEELVKGTGQEAKKGNFVGMYYSGKVQGRKKTFDSCLSGKPFRFRLGSGQVITGWERGILGMREGGKRRLTLAPNMGYGAGGAPPDIPGNATLVFDIECKYVKMHASQEKL